MDRAHPSLRIVRADARCRGFVRGLSAEVFRRFGDYERVLPRMMRLSWMRTFVAELDGEAVGFAMLSLEGVSAGETELTAIAVVPGRQGKGVARALLAHVEQETLGRVPRDIPAAIGLTVAEDNDRARHVFRAAGYRFLPGAEDEYPAGQRSLSMCKTLRGARLDSPPGGQKVV